jgi:hypothetical protein
MYIGGCDLPPLFPAFFPGLPHVRILSIPPLSSLSITWFLLHFSVSTLVLSVIIFLFWFTALTFFHGYSERRDQKV